MNDTNEQNDKKKTAAVMNVPQVEAQMTWPVDLPTEAMNPIVAIRDHALHPMVMRMIGKLCTTLSQSGIVPKTYQGSPANCFVAIQSGAMVGLAPLQAMQSIAVINGMPALYGDGLLAVLQREGVEIDEDLPATFDKDATATCAITWKGKTTIRTFTYADAARAKLVGKTGPWSEYPCRMLQMRARAFAARDACADILKGLRSVEELRDVRSFEEAEVVSVTTSPVEPTETPKVTITTPEEPASVTWRVFRTKTKKLGPRQKHEQKPGDQWFIESVGGTLVLNRDGEWTVPVDPDAASRAILAGTDTATPDEPTEAEQAAKDGNERMAFDRSMSDTGMTASEEAMAKSEPAPDREPVVTFNHQCPDGIEGDYWIDEKDGAVRVCDHEGMFRPRGNGADTCKQLLADRIVVACKDRGVTKHLLAETCQRVVGTELIGLLALSPSQLWKLHDAVMS